MRRIGTAFAVVLFAGVFLLTGCSTAQRDMQRRSAYVDSHPELSEDMAESIIAERVMVGMTEDMVAASWGQPSRTQEIKDEHAAVLWVYGNAFVGGPLTNLYFDTDHKLVKYEVQDIAHTGDQQAGGGDNNSVIAPTSTATGSLAKGPSY